MSFKVLFVSVLFSICSDAMAFTMFDLQQQKEVSLESLVQNIDDDALVLLGETHYVPALMKAQGLFIDKVVSKKRMENQFSVGWEFLNYPKQAEIDRSFSLYVSNTIDFNELLTSLFSADSNNAVYEPLFIAAKKHGGTILATNAPRAWKRIVVQDGVDALDPNQVPQYMVRGSEDYFDRFIAAIGGHGDPSALEGYFMAQSYTDAVMAERLYLQQERRLQFMIVGYFHTDFGHGLPFYLKAITPRQIINIRMVDQSEDLAQLKKPHDLYGYVADYLLIVR